MSEIEFAIIKPFTGKDKADTYTANDREELLKYFRYKPTSNMYYMKAGSARTRTHSETFILPTSNAKVLIDLVGGFISTDPLITLQNYKQALARLEYFASFVPIKDIHLFCSGPEKEPIGKFSYYEEIFRHFLIAYADQVFRKSYMSECTWSMVTSYNLEDYNLGFLEPKKTLELIRNEVKFIKGSLNFQPVLYSY